MFYVYELWNPLNNQPFYVGKGKFTYSRNQRWKRHISEAKKWGSSLRKGNSLKIKTIKNILEKDKEPFVKIIFETESEEEAFIKERELIDSYGRLVNNTGILTNIIRGGSGDIERIDDEIRKLKSIQMKGLNNHMYGKHHTEETKKQISKTKIQRHKSGMIIPKKHTEEWKQKLREDNPGGKATSKKVYQIGIDGNIIKLWSSTRQAGLSLGIKNWRNISNSIRKKNLTVGGFYWRYKNSEDIINGKLQNIEELNYSRLRKMKASKKIKQIGTNGEVIKIWPSLSEASRNLDISVSSISSAIKNNRKSGGFYWRFIK